MQRINRKSKATPTSKFISFNFFFFKKKRGIKPKSKCEFSFYQVKKQTKSQTQSDHIGKKKDTHKP